MTDDRQTDRQTTQCTIGSTDSTVGQKWCLVLPKVRIPTLYSSVILIYLLTYYPTGTRVPDKLPGRRSGTRVTNYPTMAALPIICLFDILCKI